MSLCANFATPVPGPHPSSIRRLMATMIDNLDGFLSLQKRARSELPVPLAGITIIRRRKLLTVADASQGVRR